MYESRRNKAMTVQNGPVLGGQDKLRLVGIHVKYRESPPIIRFSRIGKFGKFHTPEVRELPLRCIINIDL